MISRAAKLREVSKRTLEGGAVAYQGRYTSDGVDHTLLLTQDEFLWAERALADGAALALVITVEPSP